jgi:hypothetical protein
LTFIPKNQAVALYRGTVPLLSSICFDLIYFYAGDIVDGTTGRIIQTNPHTDCLRSIYPDLFAKVKYSKEHACCLLGQASLFCVDGSYHCLNVDHLPNRGGIPWGSLVNSSSGLVS